MSRSRTHKTSSFGKLLISLLVACLTGGAILAGIALPVAVAAGKTANAATGLFEENVSDLGFTEPSSQSVMLAADGSVLANFYTENRIVVPSDQISQYMKDAVVAIEDRRFYQHHGVDVQGIARAFVGNLAGGSIAGGSSITQQYVKNALVERGRITENSELISEATERSLGRKINEARIALAVEKKMSKEEILTGYLNLAQFGVGTFGVETAARRYFSVSAKDLSIVQAATLAGVTQSPGKWDPIMHPEDSQKRRDTVLGEMLSLGFISQEEHDQAVATPVADTLNPSEPTNGCASAGSAAYFCEYVIKDVLKNKALGATEEERVNAIYRGGLTIQTTLDPTRQGAAYDTVINTVPINDTSGTQMALSNVEPGTGKILAMAQNTNYGTATDADPTATQVNLNAGKDLGGGNGFQTGSTFKVFTLIEWLKAGHAGYDIVNSNGGSIPVRQFKASCAPDMVASNEVWNFHNYGNANPGNISVARGTEMSLNGTFARMALQLDLCNIIDTAKALGAQQGNTNGQWIYSPSAVIGVNELTPVSIANVAATLAAEGKACTLLSYTKITDSDGKEIATNEPSCKQVITPEIARETTSILRNVYSARGTGAAVSVPGHTLAGKSGTTDDATNAWQMTYTPSVALSIWQGHAGGYSAMYNLRVNGRYYREVNSENVPAAALQAFMRSALADKPNEPFTEPSRNVVSAPARQQSNTQGSNNSGNSTSSANSENTQNSSQSQNSQNNN